MKKSLIFCIITVFVSLDICAQITSTTNQAITIHNYTPTPRDYLLKQGATVTIYGYKKKKDKYHFAIVAEDFATIFSFNEIPFHVEEKQLKKLPNALSDGMKAFISEKHEEIIAAKKAKRKQEALDGKIHFVIYDNYLLLPTDDAFGRVSNGDTIYVLGYTSEGFSHKYALYTNSAVGIFKSDVKDQKISSILNADYLPSTDDTDVRIILRQIELELKRKQEEYNLQYRKNALAGKVKGIVSTYFTNDEFRSSPFSFGDTVSIVGYSYKDYRNYFALYSDKAAGIFQTSSLSSAFKNSNQLKVDLLPSVDAPEVSAVLARQQEVIDSLLNVELAEKEKKLNELKQQLIQLYKEHIPILVTDVYWSSNSVGGIEVQLSVTNCSQQTIKYITFNGYFLNAVGDKCRNEIGGGTTWSAKGIGPIGPCPTTLENYDERLELCEGSYNFDTPTFYSRVADSFVLSSVTIQYMNGKTVTISGANMEKRVRYRYPN